MNQLIQELANQAGLFVDFNGQPWPRALSADECATAYNQFAELIVRRAMDYASRNWEHGHLLAEDLRVYFGVEK